eukprot:870331-Prorocentrum_minimum.AAC.5
MLTRFGKHPIGSPGVFQSDVLPAVVKPYAPCIPNVSEATKWSMRQRDVLSTAGFSAGFSAAAAGAAGSQAQPTKS